MKKKCIWQSVNEFISGTKKEPELEDFGILSLVLPFAGSVAWGRSLAFSELQIL